jgi:alkylation response protein AidB-like acyl-CoA dehydrogenase
MTMDLDFTAEQDMLREMVRNVCAASSSLETVRTLEDDPVGYSAELWKQLAELDLLGLMLPVEYGGSGMTALEGVVLYEEFGRALVASPHFVSAVMGAGLLLRAGSDAQREQLVTRIASGDEIVTTAWLEREGGFGPRGIRATATADGDGFRLDGTKWHVPFATSATRIVVLARTSDAEAGVDLFLVDPDAAGVELTQQFTLGSENQYVLTLSGVEVPGADRIGAPGTGWTSWSETLLEGIVFLAAQAIGGARAALELTTQYAKDREQFDKPLGAFQAIAHYLADASTAVEGGEILVHEAAAALAHGQPIDQLAPMAKLFACGTYRDVTAMAQQVFGGVGFTLEYDIQLYFRRAKQQQISWWDDRALEERIAACVLDA